MRASYARSIAYENNKTAKGISEITKIIEKNAKKGKFKVKILIHHDWGYYLTLSDILKNKGYIVVPSSQQVDPNSSDYFLDISWE